jgi:hypothetical protein
LLPIPRLHAKDHSLRASELESRMTRILDLYRAVQGELLHELAEYHAANIVDNSRPYVLHFGEGMTPNYTVLTEETHHVDLA